ncbi:uncharacterized protein LOC9654558 [Selaginella moellendorffii]|nr:uncharacterized protein LOC9654558 [Selaginella moellendorffii]|eukprot:XP_002964474.2 uncharacterized protein LOC9654558 [Selaginella moellendorffii]
MAMAAVPYSCLVRLQRSRPRIVPARCSSPGPATIGCCRWKKTRYFSGFLSRRPLDPARALDEEGYYVQEEQDYIHPRYPFSNQFNPVDDRTLLEKAADELEKITPLKAVKIATLAALVWTAAQWFLGAVVFNSSLWMYASWALIFWPWQAALLVGAGACFLAHKRYTRWDDRKYRTRARDRDALIIIAGALLWLILVPLGHFQGYVEGFPAIFYGVYCAFSMFERMIRMRVYGKTDTSPEDKDWALPVSRATWIGFVGSVVVGHWLAAFESPPLVESWNLGWQTKVAAVMVLAALALKYYGTYFLLKFSKKVDSPNIVVPFGPYRWVRHPIYGSSILLFSAFCLALRAYGSMALILAGCLFYYEQLVQREEELLLKHFGEEYGSYKRSVTKKYVPYLY